MLPTYKTYVNSNVDLSVHVNISKGLFSGFSFISWGLVYLLGEPAKKNEKNLSHGGYVGLCTLLLPPLVL